MKMHLKISSAKWRPFCLGLNVLNLGEWESLGGRLNTKSRLTIIEIPKMKVRLSHHGLIFVIGILFPGDMIDIETDHNVSI